MAGKSNIEWTGHTWNPIVGCSIKSPGCAKCYAMPMAARIEAINAAAIAEGGKPPMPHYDGTTKIVNGHKVFTGKVARAPEATLLAPLKRKKPTTYFVNSMSDLFHENVPDDWIDLIFAVMALTPQHTYQVLTKRSARMRDYFVGDRFREAITPLMWSLSARRTDHLRALPLHNVWLGVSTERQQEADERIPLLLQTPAAVRFISAEPLLGPIDLTNLGGLTMSLNAFTGKATHLLGMQDQTAGALSWTIIGGESGGGYRDMDPAWAKAIIDQCVGAGVAVFMKQMAGKKPIPPEMLVRQFPKAA